MIDYITDVKEKIRRVLANRSEVLFAYLHGSFLDSDSPGDIDIALYLRIEIFDELTCKGEMSMDFVIPLELEIERLIEQKTDIQIINKAPLSFRFSVISSGNIIIDNDSNVRSDFESLSRVEYYDFRPKLEEYLGEVMV